MAKKDHRKQNRKRKQQQLRRQQSLSPYRAATRAAGEIECYCTEAWQEQGMASILAVKDLPSGGKVLAAFLVDLWCCGLKDAWGRLDITAAEVDEAVEGAEQRGASMVPTDIDIVRELVAGGIRFAKQNGFRLPHRYERWVEMIGVKPAEALESASLELFGTEGNGKGLRFVGLPSDLRQRLVGSSVEEFAARPDVEVEDIRDYVDADEIPEEDEEAEDAAEAFEDMRDSLHGKILERAKQWCFANGKVPHPALGDAVDAMLESVMHIEGADERDPDSPEVAEESERLFHQTLEMHGRAREEELQQALAQLSEWMSTFDSPSDLMAIMGLPGEDEEEEEHGK